MGEPILLGTRENPKGRSFASIEQYRGDIALLNYLLQDLRVLLRRHRKGEITLTEMQTLTWDVHGLERRTVVCHPAELLEQKTVCIVGFFGDRRTDADQNPIDASEFDLIAEFTRFPGILSYSSVELVDGYWANLVVHRENDDREDWRASEVHKKAVDDVAPRAYHSVRIHNGCVLEGATSSNTVIVESTKYWDYDTTPTWHATRMLPGGARAVLGGPIPEEPTSEPSQGV